MNCNARQNKTQISGFLVPDVAMLWLSNLVRRQIKKKSLKSTLVAIVNDSCYFVRGLQLH